MNTPQNLQPAAEPGATELGRFLKGEDGAAYTLSYVMVIPMYALLLCVIIESVLMISAKLGTVYAAFTAARTASVWSSATTWEKAMAKAKHSAVKSITPFASGMRSLPASLPPTGDLKNAGKYVVAYEAFAKNSVAAKYILAKYGYATRHTQVTIDGPPTTWNGDIKAKVTYEFPFVIPGVARIFGRRGADGRYYFPITSEATIPNEGPQDDRKTIGIGYGTLE
jgi:hypothetical protein